jgi:hypothetical protein
MQPLDIYCLCIRKTMQPLDIYCLCMRKTMQSLDIYCLCMRKTMQSLDISGRAIMSVDTYIDRYANARIYSVFEPSSRTQTHYYHKGTRKSIHTHVLE